MKSTALKLLALSASILLVACESVTADIGDVERFLERREMCEHFRGELPEPSQEDRFKEVIEAENKYCTGTDTELETLKKKYAKDPEILKKLSQFEESIEATTPPKAK